MNFITLKELKKMVPVASEFKRVPGLKKILEDGIEVILRKQMENHAEVVVYKNGYVSYHAHERYTVFALHNCTHYYYESQGNEHQTIPHNHFEDMEWHIRLVLEGEDRLVRNLEARESETFSYAADVNPEYNNEMEDPRINVMDFVLNKEFLRKASELLKKHQWEMICRHYIEGMTHREIAAEIQDWAGVYPLFHWSFIPWGFYLVLAVAFGFMLHVRKRNRQKYSEACRPILGKHTDGWAGRIIDLLAVFALLAGTATTFSVATPLMATIIGELFHVAISRTVINIIILLITCAVYTYSLLHGFKGISKLANICIYMFFGLIAFVLLFGGETRYIVETGFASLGKMVQNFIDLSTFTDPLRTSNFPQNWTIYYWAYWMVWCVAAPFFIGNISRGRTVRQTILGGYVFGVGSTLTSFIVLGNYSMGMQVTGKADFIAQYMADGDLYGMIVSIIKTMPFAPVIMVVVLLTMIAFYATSFDSIALTASCYSYHKLEDGEQPNKGIQLMWCVLLILLPIALLFAESSMNNLQSVSIVAAFPIGAVIVMITVSFMKDAKKYMESLEERKAKK